MNMENLLKPVPKTEPSVEPLPPEPPYVTAGPPFPKYPTDQGRYGISILDYFAAHVIAGLATRNASSIDDLKINGARDAYWIAAMMVDLRNQLTIDPTPVPPIEASETVIRSADAVVRLGRKPPAPG